VIGICVIVVSASTTFSSNIGAGLVPQQRSRRLLLTALPASIALHVAALMLLPGFVEPQGPLTVQVLNVVLLQPESPSAVVPQSPPLPSGSDLRRPPRTQQPMPRIEKQSAPPATPREKSSPPPEAPEASDSQTIATPSSETPSPSQSETPGVADAKPEPAPPTAEIAPPAFNATYLQNPAPRYPLMARRNGEQGTVTLRVLVTREGLPARVSIERSSGSSQLDGAALETVKTWRFVPARQGQESIEAWVLVPIVFRLEGTS
jgi:protein TonB